MGDPYDWWREALQGRFGPIHEGDPRPGFYLRKLFGGKGAPLSPVAIWRNGNGELTAMQMIIVRPTEVNPNDVWTWAAGWPIPEELYRTIERQTWPPGLEKFRFKREVA
jgi:hypothetical protein